MRRKDREITDIHKIEEILARAKYLHLGLFDDEYPYVVPLHYGYVMENEKLTFYVHCAREGHKLDCINKNNNVFIEIDCGEKLIAADMPCQYSAEYMSVMCRGTATVLQDAKEKCAALHILMKIQAGEDYEINEKMVDAVNVIRIQVDSYSAKARVR
ncbi:MAG: pyridoxamine 5'-phosphate oxidase family protein [Lachnospiraceae bacterium]